MRRSKEDVAHAMEMLKKFVKRGTKVYTVLRHVARSGMSRRIDLYVIHKGAPVYISGWAAIVLERTLSPKGGIVEGGCGMDMGFHLVHCLSYKLHGYPKQGVEHKQNDPHRPGYTLHHEWM